MCVCYSLLLRGETDWLKSHLVKVEGVGERKGKEFEMSAELISALIPNDSRTSLALIQTVVLFQGT